MKHIISAVVENQPGVLARIVGLISGRGYNIDSLNVAPTQDPTVSRLTLVAPGNDQIIEQITKQLNKLIDVIKVTDLTQEKHLDRELALITVQTTPRTRSQVIELAALFRAQVVSVHAKSLTIQMVGPSDEVDNFMDLLQPFGIQDTSRSGTIAVAKAE
jgi:acetolactate synthase-1/3 small subunit